MSRSLPGAGASRAETAAAVARRRSKVPRGLRIPEQLWARAVELAGTQGVGPVAMAWRLDYNTRFLKLAQEPTQAAGAATLIALLKYGCGLLFHPRKSSPSEN